MRKYAESVSSAADGLPVYLAEIGLLKADNTPASLFSDQGVTPLTQPVLTDGLGAFSFYVADGTYTLVVADPGGANPRVFPNTEIYEDARNVSVPLGEAGLTLPSVGARAGMALAFDGGGLPVAIAADSFTVTSGMQALADAAAASAGTATTQAGVATTQAGLAASSKTAADADVVLTHADVVIANAAAAAAAASAGNTYSTLALALAGSTSGQYLGVMQAGGFAVDLYQNVSGSLVMQGTTPITAGVQWAAKIAAEGTLADQMPVTPLFWAQMADGKFTDGQLVPSRMAATTPSRNMLQRPDVAQTSTNGAVITAGQPDPWGGTTAFRVQLPASNSFQELFKISSGATPSEVGGYRIGFLAKSNTGAGNQNFTLHKTLGTPSVTTAVIEASWTAGELVLPGLVNNDSITIYNPSGTTPLDLLITPLAISQPEVKLPSHPIPNTGGLVDARLSRPGNMTIDNSGNLVTPYRGRINFTDDGIARRQFSAMTMWVCFKQTGSSAAGQFNAAFWSRTTSFSDIVLGTEANSFKFIMPGMSSFNADPSWLAYGDEFLTLCLRFDATRSIASLGSIELATGTGTGGTPHEMAFGYMGRGFNDTYPLTGMINSWGVIPSFLEDTQLSQLVRSVNQRAALYGNALGARSVLFSAGDSVTNGAGATTPSSTGFMPSIATALGLKRINEAVSGTDFYAMAANPRFSDFKRKISQCVSDGKRAIVHILIGTNSTQPTQADYQAYINAVKALGTSNNPVKVVVGTIPDRGSRTPSITAAYNAMVRTLTVDAVADYASNANIGGAGAATNTTYFNVDQIHPNQTGHDIMAAIGQPVIAALRA